MNCLQIINPKARLKGSRAESFTLVELLVVVAILSILAAMMFPALKAARESAKSIKCVNNLHQLGVAIHIYATENEGMMPKHTHGVTPWYARLTNHVGRTSGKDSVFVCPSLPQPVQSYGMCGIPIAAINEGGAACTGFRLGTKETNLGDYNVNIASFARSSDCALLGESPRYQWFYNIPDTYSIYPHREGSNFLMVDGRVAFYTKVQVGIKYNTATDPFLRVGLTP